MKLLNAGCGSWYADGWVNTDVWQNDLTRPDILVKKDEPYPFDSDTFDAVYLGHVLEHIKWERVPDFLQDMMRVAKPGAPVLIVGPDVHRCLNLWKLGRQPYNLLLATMEHQDIMSIQGADWWDGAAHCWNCYEDRVVRLLNSVGVSDVKSYSDIVPDDPSQKSWFDKRTKITWPVVGKHEWQFAVKFDNPS